MELTASASSGVFGLAKMPMQMVMMPAPRQVAQASAPASMPAPESTAGLTAMM